jgi:tetratricopeptide (TPR) repeat protein
MKSGAEKKFHLGKAWRMMGDPKMARTSFQEALEMDEGYIDARIALADLLLDEGRISEALKHYDHSLEIQPDHPKLEFRRQYLKTLSKKKASPASQEKASYPDSPEGKICINRQKLFSCHRGGWNTAIDSLAPLHHRDGVYLDSFVEDNFAWKHWKEGLREPDVLKRLMHEGGFEDLATSEEKGITPYKQPWIGIIHNPHNMPSWFHPQESPQTIFSKEIWRRSIEHCKGIICLSDYQAEWLRSQLACPVLSMIHPAEIPAAQFDFEHFQQNPHKKVVQVGWWLRKLNAILGLPLATGNPLGYGKVRLVPRFFDDADRYLKELMAKESENLNIPAEEAYAANTEELQHLSNQDYDDLLTENIVFLDLYDSGANNTVVECIARATPLLVNRRESVLQYLGEEYPFYYDSYEEAARKALDLPLVEATHLYLKSCPTRRRLSFDYFRESLENSDLYQALPSPAASS